VVLGGLNMDLVLHMDRLPRPGETVEAGSLETTPGGKGGNQAIAAARAFGEPGAVAMVGKVGDDAYGQQLVAYLAAAGVETSKVGRVARASSGLAIIAIDAAGENTVTAVYGANDHVGAAEADAAAELVQGAAILLVQQETPLEPTLAAMQAARNAGTHVILDPAPARTLPKGFLRHATIITPNQTEAEALSGIPAVGLESARQAATAIRERHGVETVIVTLGGDGALVQGPRTEVQIAAFPVKAVASVGAGDAFNGALAAALAEGQPLEAAARFAAAAGALCVTREGAAASMPQRHEILELAGAGRLRA
jgi:ribokinase